MSKERKVRIKTLLVALVMVTCANTGDLLLKRGMSRIGAVEISVVGLSQALRMAMLNPVIWLGILFLTGYMASLMTVMSWADYSYVMPVGAFGYAVNAMLAVVFLHETVSIHRWTGVFVICVGVLLVGQTKPTTVSNPPV
jgi:drug/metabolite transporter (DMT)-like permease